MLLQESAEYELSMVVAHVRESWMEVSGNLVTHILVPPFYHARKKVSCSPVHAVCAGHCTPPPLIDPSEVPVVFIQ